MKSLPKLAILASALAAVTVLPASVFAQENPVPGKSVESYGTWTVECNNIKVKPKKEGGEPTLRKLCEAIQTYTNQKTGNEVARLAFAVDEKDKKKLIGGMRMIVDASFEKKPRLMVDDKELFTGKFNRCTGIYCFAQLNDITDKKIDQLSKSKKVKVEFPVSSGRMMSIKVSVDGLADSLKALKAK